VIAVDDFPEARVPAWKLTIDFGPEIGVKRSSAQITSYAREQLEGRLVVAVVNFPPRRIGPFSSEVLVLGALDQANTVILLRPDDDVEPGAGIGLGGGRGGGGAGARGGGGGGGRTGGGRPGQATCLSCAIRRGSSRALSTRARGT